MFTIADDLARGEVLTRGLVTQLGEPAEQLLEEVAHRVVRDGARVQVQVGELAQHQVEQAGLVQAADLLVEAVLLQHLHRIRAEGVDVGAQVAGQAVRVVQELGERQRAGVVERHPGGLLQQRPGVVRDARELDGGRQDLGLGGLQHRVQATQDQQRQDHPAVLRRPVVTPQQVSDLPDKLDLALEAVHARPHTRPAGLAAGVVRTLRRQRDIRGVQQMLGLQAGGLC